MVAGLWRKGLWPEGTKCWRSGEAIREGFLEEWPRSGRGNSVCKGLGVSVRAAPYVGPR